MRSERLAYDTEGRFWFGSFRETSVLIWRAPYRVFSRLADGSTEPAWRFAVAWAILAGLLRWAMQESWLLPVLGVIIGTFWWAIDSLLLYLAMRVLGAQTTWRLAARVAGYGAAWTGPALLARAPAALFDGSEMEWWLLYSILSILVLNGGAAYGYYAFARGRALFSLQRAAAAALLATVPGAGLQVLGAVWSALRAPQ